jgi:hypothetical protein
MHRQSPFAAIVALLVVSLAAPLPHAAAMSPDRAAALITFPYVTADARRGADTAIRISNADAQEAIDVACFLENHTPRCVVNAQQACLADADCPSGDVCDSPAVVATTQFAFRLTAAQPITWRLSAGLAALPLPQNSGAIPPAPDPFRGALRCIATEPSGAPSERNVLQGEATHERYDAALSLLDAATYNGLALPARSGALNDDGQLVLGTAAGEYDGCPGALHLNHLFDLALDPVSSARQLFTTLALLPCAAELWHTGPFNPAGGAVVQYLVFNEFEQRFSTSNVLHGQNVNRLSAIDSSIQERSIFSAGVAGTLAGHTQIMAFGGGIMGVAVEAHQSTSDPDRVSTAAFNLHSEGERSAADTIDATFRCPRQPVGGCRSAGASRVRLDQRPRSGGGRVKWEWRQGQATSAGEFGDPVHTAEYALCVYAGTGAGTVAELMIPAGSQWAPSRGGYTYTDPARAADGVAKVVLKGSRRDHARAALRARGATVPPLGLANGLQTPVILQLINTDTATCLESVFESDDVRANEPGLFDGQSRADP